VIEDWWDRLFEVWLLELLWSLDVGPWSLNPCFIHANPWPKKSWKYPKSAQWPCTGKGALKSRSSFS
jgi:hypothetical protein